MIIRADGTTERVDYGARGTSGDDERSQGVAGAAADADAGAGSGSDTGRGTGTGTGTDTDTSTRTRPTVQWADDVVDNEGMGKKKSKSEFC